MTTSRCSAKDRTTCRYHGTQSASILRALRDKVSVAHSVYSATEGAAQFEAYENLRKAEIDYYATDEGQDNLIDAIQKSVSGDYRDMLLDIQRNSQETRMRNELSDGDMAAMWGQPAPKVPAELPRVTTLAGGLNDEGHMIHVLSRGTSNGTNFDFTWNASTGRISYGETDETGSEDMDSVRFLGRAANMEEAKAIATKWYRQSVVG